MNGITVCIPTIPPRRAKLRQAVTSVMAQDVPAAALSIAVDLEKQGAAATRDRALRAVQTPWTAFLDDDDQMKQNHLAVLAAAAEESGADYVFSWYEAAGFGRDPLPHFGKVYDHANPTQTTITILVRTELAQQIGFREPPPGARVHGQTYGEDYQFTVECIEAGAKILHVAERTWIWNYWGGNTSGRPDRW
jgi:glycosyltransferase involved in cell wall biosynthesis